MIWELEYSETMETMLQFQVPLKKFWPLNLECKNYFFQSLCATSSCASGSLSTRQCSSSSGLQSLLFLKKNYFNLK